jgi:CRP-like cAMP-binding protein
MSANTTLVRRSGNLFLSALSEENFKSFKQHLELLEMKLGDIIHKPNEPVRHVYFPEDAIVSIVTYLEDGSNIETGIIGNEGIAGIGIILSDDISPRESVIQVAGKCLKVKAEIFKDFFEQGGEFNRLALRFVYAFIAQISQNAACNNRHRVETRLARWLLSIHDRVEGNEINSTQEFIAQMLGTNRPTVSESASKLQDRGLIKYSRGQIEIIDRKRLEQVSCECYRAIKDAYDKYLH